jgi:exosortase/archaeosortase family protein
MKNGNPPKTPHGVSLKRFALVYVIMMGVFLSIFEFTRLQEIINFSGYATRTVAWISAHLLGLMGMQVTYHDSILVLPTMSFRIIFGCTGLKTSMIYTIAVVAFPSPWRMKFIGIAAGVLTIQLLNILRIIAHAYVAVYFRSMFDFTHVYIAQGIMVTIALGIFFIYLNYAKPYSKVAS